MYNIVFACKLINSFYRKQLVYIGGRSNVQLVLPYTIREPIGQYEYTVNFNLQYIILYYSGTQQIQLRRLLRLL